MVLGLLPKWQDPDGKVSDGQLPDLTDKSLTDSGPIRTTERRKNARLIYIYVYEDTVPRLSLLFVSYEIFLMAKNYVSCLLDLVSLIYNHFFLLVSLLISSSLFKII